MLQGKVSQRPRGKWGTGVQGSYNMWQKRDWGLKEARALRPCFTGVPPNERVLDALPGHWALETGAWEPNQTSTQEPNT